jgi:hypothetical protein
VDDGDGDPSDTGLRLVRQTVAILVCEHQQRQVTLWGEEEVEVVVTLSLSLFPRYCREGRADDGRTVGGERCRGDGHTVSTVGAGRAHGEARERGLGEGEGESIGVARKETVLLRPRYPSVLSQPLSRNFFSLPSRQ